MSSNLTDSYEPETEHDSLVLSRDFRIPQPGERWMNHKGGIYHIDHVGLHTETGEPSVAYFPADQFDDYRREGPGAVSWFHRPLGFFLGTTTSSAGAHVRRFVRCMERP